MTSQKLKHLSLIFLALIFSVLAPLRAMALSPAAIAVAIECGAVAAQEMDCCKTKQICCCTPAPVQPNNLESAAQPGQITKIIPVKSASRAALLNSSVRPACTLLDPSPYEQSIAVISDQLPLYLLKR